MKTSFGCRETKAIESNCMIYESFLGKTLMWVAGFLIKREHCINNLDLYCMMCSVFNNYFFQMDAVLMISLIIILNHVWTCLLNKQLEWIFAKQYIFLIIIIIISTSTHVPSWLNLHLQVLITTLYVLQLTTSKRQKNVKTQPDTKKNLLHT